MFSPISAKTFCEPARLACCSRSRRQGISRRGISLFEVLISILVAAIGVFGVLVLIPFAVRNAQKGIDREAGINAAKNFIADFQAYGYQNPETWHDTVADVQVISPLSPSFGQHLSGSTFTSNIQFGWPYIIDPIGAASNGTPYGQFPDDPAIPADMPRLNIANLFEPGSIIPSGIALARRMSMQPDDLNFDEPATELAGPRQVYYELGDEKFAKRQFNARYLTFSIVVPDDDAGQQYRMYTIVGTDGDRGVERVFEVIDPDQSLPPGPANTMRLRKTDSGTLGTREYEQVGLGGGDLLLSEIATSGQPALTEDQIRNNDWMMLISYHQPVDPTLGPPSPVYDDIQISFYRVIHADRVSPVAGSAPGTPGDGITGRGPAERTFHVTLQGPDVDLYRDWAAKMVGNRTDVPTYAVLIPNVLAVYERTFRTEPDSSWQAQ